MWFNNALIFQYEIDKTTDFEQALQSEAIKPCPAHARFIYGWGSVFENALTLQQTGCILIKLSKEERILPRGVIHKIMQEKIEQWEELNARTMKRADKAQLAEELEFDLLPKAFTVDKHLPAIIDERNKRIIINTSSTSQALQLIALLRKSIPEMRIVSLGHEDNLTTKFSQWINNPLTLPANFELASDCLLIALDNEKKRCNFKGYDLPSDEVSNLLEKGMVPAEIPLIWNDRIQFTLTHSFALKRLKCLDYLHEEFNETRHLEDERQQMEAELTLLTGEFQNLIEELLNAITSDKITDAKKITSETVEA